MIDSAQYTAERSRNQGEDQVVWCKVQEFEFHTKMLP